MVFNSRRSHLSGSRVRGPSMKERDAVQQAAQPANVLSTREQLPFAQIGAGANIVRDRVRKEDTPLALTREHRTTM